MIESPGAIAIYQIVVAPTRFTVTEIGLEAGCAQTVRQLMQQNEVTRCGRIPLKAAVVRRISAIEKCAIVIDENGKPSNCRFGYRE